MSLFSTVILHLEGVGFDRVFPKQIEESSVLAVLEELILQELEAVLVKP